MMGLSQQSSELGRTGSKASSSPVMLQHNSSMSATADEQLFKTPTDLVRPGPCGSYVSKAGIAVYAIINTCCARSHCRASTCHLPAQLSCMVLRRFDQHVASPIITHLHGTRSILLRQTRIHGAALCGLAAVWLAVGRVPKIELR